ncbi:hypothetical protein LINGRAPRIM_LOCUS1217 [Linum grandiflorum]
MQRQLDSLHLDEDEAETVQFVLPTDPIPILDFKNCVVGSLLTTRPYNFQKLKHRMAIVWEPGMWMKAEELGQNLLLFRFYSELDLRWVIDNGPWHFERFLLVLHELKTGEDPTMIPLHHADSWVQIHNLQPSFFRESVGRGLGDFIGKYVSYDTERNVYKNKDSFIRIRVTLDTTKPLKRTKKVSHPGTIPIISKFSRMGHADRLCSVRFQNPAVEPERLWDDSIRAIPRKKTLGGEKWLIEDEPSEDPQNPPNLRVFQHNYAAHGRIKMVPDETEASSQNAENMELVVMDERKRRRTAAQHMTDTEPMVVDINETSPPKMLKTLQEKPKNLAKADLLDRYCQGE